jgi:hypothetical protein
VNFHFLISGVTRAFTHQMVRQRTAVYAQESVRFAVKEDVPVALPASVAGTMLWKDWLNKCWAELYPVADQQVTGNAQVDELRLKQVQEYAANRATPQQLWRREWDEAVADIASSYNGLVEAGMPAEDARGLLPTNLQTRIHYHTNLRNLYEHAGMRLCTQAQHEWKVVWVEILKALENYGKGQHYFHDGGAGSSSSYWQFKELAKVFKPICWGTNKCEFMSSADRFCSIRDRVQAFHHAGVDSNEWSTGRADLGIPAIGDQEWKDNHASARVSQ